MLSKTADFFANYLEWNESTEKYTLWSGPQEGSRGQDSSADIALLKQLLTRQVENGKDLPADAAKDMLDHLPAVPTTTVDGKTVCSLAQAGSMQGGDTRDVGDDHDRLLS